MGGNTSLSCHVGRQRASAATCAGKRRPRCRPRHSLQATLRLRERASAAGAPCQGHRPPPPRRFGRLRGARGASLSHPPALRCGSSLWGAGGREYLQSCNFGCQGALAATGAATTGQLTRPTSQGAGHGTPWPGSPADNVLGLTRSIAGCSSAPWRLVDCSRKCPTHPPAQRFGSALPGAGGWEYLLSCHNGGPCALAAMQPTTIGQQVRPRDYSTPHLGSASDPWRPPLSPKSWLCRHQCTVAAGAPPQEKPRPPAPVGARAPRPPLVCSAPCLPQPPALRLGPPFGGGWVGQFLGCNWGGQRALASRGAGG